MTTCVILHHIIIEDESDLNSPIKDVIEAPTPTTKMEVNENLRIEQPLARHRKKLKTKMLILNFLML
ncbi:hypothetical protein EJD97_005764 [Solanum chilense]|uniref:Uncharacterized protein n=1 Tax=Solanum chilense TaxID=4083 RepID=A0A6N2AMW1_SOLCI|nr:hypothetical protein EJD97_005764 [Solanum chilense]